MKKKKLIKYLKNKLKECDSNMIDYFQELDDPDRGQEEIGKIALLKEIIEYLK